jgi:hypothetical protein
MALAVVAKIVAATIAIASVTQLCRMAFLRRVERRVCRPKVEETRVAEIVRNLTFGWRKSTPRQASTAPSTSGRVEEMSGWTRGRGTYELGVHPSRRVSRGPAREHARHRHRR